MNYKLFFILVLVLTPLISYSQKIDTIYSSELIKIIGDTTLDENKFESILIKFQPYISFQDFPTRAIFKGKKAPIDYKSNITARQFKTRITETYNLTGLNFGGHYCFVYWGCGSACQSSAVVDLITGKVYDGPTASHQYEFEKRSYMVIVNPPESSGYIYDCPGCIPEIWIWDENKKIFKQKTPFKK